MKKKVLFALIALFSFVSTWAQGADPVVAKIGDVGYATLQDAIDAVEDGQVILLQDDIESPDEAVSFALGKEDPCSYTIDMNGYDITAVYDYESGGLFNLKTSNTNVTITNSKTGGGTITGTGTDPDDLLDFAMVNVGTRTAQNYGSSLTINAGVTLIGNTMCTLQVVSALDDESDETEKPRNTVNVYGTVKTQSVGDFIGWAIGTHGHWGQKGGIINVYEGAVVTGTKAGIYLPSGECNIFGGTITGPEAGIAQKSGTLNVSGGTIIATTADDADYVFNPSGFTGYGHALQIENCTQANPQDAEITIYPEGAPVVNITGGTFISPEGTDAIGSYANGEYNNEQNTRIVQFLNAGVFGSDDDAAPLAADLFADGYGAYKTESDDEDLQDYALWEVGQYTVSINPEEHTYTGEDLKNTIVTIVRLNDEVVDDDEYDVQYFSDAACEHEVQAIINAGTYYVRPYMLYDATAEPEEISSENANILPAVPFVVKQAQVELMLQEISKNFGDPDPVFFQVNGDWRYTNVNGEAKLFYTLKDADSKIISSDKIRLYNVEFVRIDEGDQAWNGTSQATYRYSVNKDDIIVAGKAAGASWADVEAAINGEAGSDMANVLTNYELVVGQASFMKIEPRNLANLELTGADVVYNGAPYNKIAAGETAGDNEVLVTGLSFESSEGETIEINPADFDVAVGDQEVYDNTNVTYEDGEVVTNASLVITAKAKKNIKGSATVAFKINPRSIAIPTKTVQVDGVDTEVEDPSADEFTVTISGSRIYTGEALTPTFTFRDGGRKDITNPVLNTGRLEENPPVANDYTYEFANNIEVSRKDNKPNGAVQEAATLTLTGEGNYCDARTVKFAVEPLDITEADFDVEIEDEDYVYDGTQKTPTVTVTPKASGDEDDPEPLTANEDYTVKYGENIHAANASSKTNSVTVEGTGNYSGSVTVYFAIDQATLIVSAVDDSKTYGEKNPEPYLVAVDGWANNDQYKKIDGKVVDDEDDEIDDPEEYEEYAAPSTLAEELADMFTIVRDDNENVGTYDLTFVDKDKKPIDTDKTYAFKENQDYLITFVEGEFEIEPRGLRIVANNATASFGDDLYSEEFEATLSASVNAEDWQFEDASKNLLDGYTFHVYVDPAKEITQGLNKNVLLVEEQDAKVAPSNYQFVFVPGNLSFGKKGITVIANAITEVYGENKEFTYTVEGLVSDPFDPTKVEGYDDMTDEQKAAAEAAYVSPQEAAFRAFLATVILDPEAEDEEDAVIYNGKPFVQEIPEGEEEASKDFSETPYNIVANDNAPEEYADNYTITYVGSTLTRNQREVNVTAKNQTGDDAIPYGKDIKKGENWYTIERANADNTRGLLDADEDIFGTVILSKDPAATSIGLHPSAIKVNVNNKNRNYKINGVKGDLEITAGDDPVIALVRPNLQNGKNWTANKGPELLFTEKDEDDEDVFVWVGDGSIDNDEQGKALYNDDDPETDERVDNTAAQVIADYDGQEVTVTFGNYAIRHGQWETLVLPFEVKVKDLSQKFGYALVDVLDEEKSTEDNIVFRKEIYTIPANTPFLIKVPDNINMGEEQVFFDGVVIVNPEDEDDLTVVAAGNKFIGTYTGYRNLDARADGVKRAHFEDGILYTGDDDEGEEKMFVYALGAYFEFNSALEGGVRITIEEEDGTTTEINAVEIAGVADAAEGWYTITGIKLEGKPATKGTYIYNGKVVYVK